MLSFACMQSPAVEAAVGVRAPGGFAVSKHLRCVSDVTQNERADEKPRADGQQRHDAEPNENVQHLYLHMDMNHRTNPMTVTNTAAV